MTPAPLGVRASVREGPHPHLASPVLLPQQCLRRVRRTGRGPAHRGTTFPSLHCTRTCSNVRALSGGVWEEMLATSGPSPGEPPRAAPRARSPPLGSMQAGGGFPGHRVTSPREPSPQREHTRAGLFGGWAPASVASEPLPSGICSLPQRTRTLPDLLLLCTGLSDALRGEKAFDGANALLVSVAAREVSNSDGQGGCNCG